jgi:hypothetical protein
LSLNFNKTYILQFWNKNSQKPDLNITLLNMHITNTTDIKFLGLTINEMSCKCNINHILSRLSTTCYAIRTVRPLMLEENLRMIYFSCALNSNLWYNVGGIYYTVIIFLRFKQIIWIITKSRYGDCCRQLLKKIRNFTLALTIYIFFIIVCGEE